MHHHPCRTYQYLWILVHKRRCPDDKAGALLVHRDELHKWMQPLKNADHSHALGVANWDTLSHAVLIKNMDVQQCNKPPNDNGCASAVERKGIWPKTAFTGNTLGSALWMLKKTRWTTQQCNPNILDNTLPKSDEKLGNSPKKSSRN
jgi:hypothetical protein